MISNPFFIFLGVVWMPCRRQEEFRAILGPPNTPKSIPHQTTFVGPALASWLKYTYLIQNLQAELSGPNFWDFQITLFFFYCLSGFLSLFNIIGSGWLPLCYNI
jgi:hypothetical protein